MIRNLLNKAIPKLYGFYFNILALYSKDKSGKAALKLFSTPRKGKVQKYQEAFLDTARSQRISFEDGFYQLYHWKGEGKTVLFAHGWESNSYRWRYIIEPLLEKGYNIVAIDAPAHGKSDGTTFTAIKYAGIIKSTIELYEPQFIIAHSVGCMATTYQESQSPHKCIEKIVFLGSPNRLDNIMKSYQEVVPFNNTVFNNMDIEVERIFKLRFKDFSVEKFAQNIQTPVLLIHNKNDEIIPFSTLRELESEFSNATVFEAPTGGHSLYNNEVAETVISFIEEIAS